MRKSCLSISTKWVIQTLPSLAKAFQGESTNWTCPWKDLFFFFNHIVCYRMSMARLVTDHFQDYRAFHQQNTEGTITPSRVLFRKLRYSYHLTIIWAHPITWSEAVQPPRKLAINKLAWGTHPLPTNLQLCYYVLVTTTLFRSLSSEIGSHSRNNYFCRNPWRKKPTLDSLI